MFLNETSICALPFEETEARESLEMRLDIASYPSLIMLGPKPDDDDDNFGDRPVINSEVRAVKTETILPISPFTQNHGATYVKQPMISILTNVW
jgi:hypothetical protein